ncbi:hypothetical protein [Thalassospira tepidiphila]|uniref:hypothetical protein n=1 Tax=Thalassospira tepidiphila TaxID=393657 RepID=UPI003AA8BABD
MKTLNIDISCSNSGNYEIADCWPTPYRDYCFLGKDLLDAIYEPATHLHNDVYIALSCKAADILTDIAHVARCTIDVQNSRLKKIQINYDENTSPVIDWILDDRTDNINRLLLRRRDDIRTESLDGSIKHILRRLKYKTLNTLERRSSSPVLSTNNLLNDYLRENNIRTHSVNFDDVFCGRPETILTTLKKKSIEDIIQSINKQLVSHIQSDELIDRLLYASSAIVNWHIRQSLGDIKRIRSKYSFKKFPDTLFSGTPKYEGRLISWFYGDNGTDIVRFAHGGERVFFFDYNWPISELPWCDTYYCHSNAEAQTFKDRFETDQYPKFAGLKKLSFKSIGSNTHRNYGKLSSLCDVTPAIIKHKNQGRRLLYASAVYHGDKAPVLPTFKLPDALYLDFQIRLLNSLKNDNWHITLKPHPKGIFDPTSILSPYIDDVMQTRFNPLQFDHDVFLFDFAGSAFFDSLFSNKHICLINLANRPISNDYKSSLCSRVSVVNSQFDDVGKIHIDMNALRSALRPTRKTSISTFVSRFAE